MTNGVLSNFAETQTTQTLGRGIAGVQSVEYTGEVLYNILLEKHEPMMVHNLIVETLTPENIIAKLAVLTKDLSGEEYATAVKTFNDYVRENNSYRSVACGM